MNRYSFSGRGNFLLKAGTTGKYGNSNYEIGEPIAYFTDVEINLSFSYLEKTPRVAIDNLSVAAKSSASYLTISNIKVTEALQSLLYKKQVNKTKNQTLIRNLNSSNGVLFLPLGLDQTLIGNLFIYNNLKIKQNNFTVDSNNNTVLGLSDGSYTVFYSVDSNSLATFFLDAPALPNLMAEIEVVGNINNSTGKAVIHLNKISLLTRPTLDFSNENPFIDNLDFAILNDKEAEVNYYAS